MLKYKNITNIFIVGVYLLFFVIIIKSKVLLHPDTLILGSWKEDFWQYVKANEKNKNDSLSTNFINEVVKEKISKHLVIHNSEEWIFKKNSTLIIRKKGHENVIAKWFLKGRGHILKIIYEDKIVELYKIKEIKKDKLILHFENDIHVRGIVKIHLIKN